MVLKLNFQNSQTDFNDAKEELEKIKNLPVPDFALFQTDLTEIRRIADKYNNYQNIIVVGNGGAINSFRGFYSCLGKDREKGKKKNVEILNTPEPDYINELKEKFPREETLVVVVSKSGTNPTALEIMFAFWDYPKLAVCTEGAGALYEIVRREELDYAVYPSPEKFPKLDDRHTGFSASGLLPAALLGIDIKGLCRGAEEMYRLCAPAVAIEGNPALQLAASFYLLERKGCIEIFCPVYSTKLHGFLPAIIQLMHETVCKEGQGQTVFGDLAPESQHHTNQRFFGGKKNILGFFITAKQEDRDGKVDIPPHLENIKIREGTLHDFKGIPYFKLLEFEFQGTFRDAVEKNFPLIHLELQEISPYSVGQFLALMQYVSIYSAYLRGVNPQGQPQVERSKGMSFELVKNLYTSPDYKLS